MARGFLPQIKSESFFEFGRSGYTRRRFLDRSCHDGSIRLKKFHLELFGWTSTALFRNSIMPKGKLSAHGRIADVAR